MGYRVGNTCYDDKQKAETAYFSGVKPTIGTDGKLYQMRHDGKYWYFEGQSMQAVLPQCNVYDNFKDGMQIGWSIFAILAVVWGFRVIQRILGIRV